METKICSTCKKILPLNDEYFNRESRRNNGFTSRCTICIKEYRAKYYQDNKERLLKLQKVYNEENKKSISKAKKIYYTNNKEHLRSLQSIWAKNNKELNKIKRKVYIEKNPHVRGKYAQRYRMKKTLLPNDLNPKEWQIILTDFSYECAYCGMSEEEHYKKWSEQLHQDHFLPLSKGGEYTVNNIIPSCRSCNSSKRNALFNKWYPQYKYYDKDRETFILNYLGYENKIQQLALF